MGKRTVVITGSSGFIGASLCEELKEEFHVVKCDRKDVDLRDAAAFGAFIDKLKVKTCDLFLINCAAHSAFAELNLGS